MARDSSGRFVKGSGSGQQSKTIGAQLRQQLATIVKATVLEVDANLRAAPDEGGTPIDTGNARANWVPSIGAPHAGEVSGNGAHDAGVALVLAYQLEQGPVYESNAAPYINSLNYGHSKQAPAMFVEAARDKAVATMQQRFGTAKIPVDKPISPPTSSE